MIEAGGGHKTPALAVVEALEELFPDKYQIKVLDFMKDLGCTGLDDAHKKIMESWKKDKKLHHRPREHPDLQTVSRPGL